MDARRLAAGLLGLALALGAADARAVPLEQPNALLVVDENARRVLRVSLADGLVSELSPPAGAQNLLTSPGGIGTGPGGTILVANVFEATLVEIDPASGAQFLLAGAFSGPPALGPLPRDVAVNPRLPAPGFLRTLGVASGGVLYQVLRSQISTVGAPLVSYPAPYEAYMGRFVAARDPGDDGPIDYYVATDAISAILFYDGSTGLLTPILEYDDGVVQGLDAPEIDPYLPYVLVVSRRVAPCPSSANGVWLLRDDGSGTDLLAGGAYQCPGPVAYDDRTGIVYSVDASTNPQRIVGYDTAKIHGTTSFEVATLPSGASASDVALAALPVPEPGATALAAIAGLALAACACGRRSGAASRRASR